MYEKFFQFTKSPFNLTPDPEFVYMSPGHQEALEHMDYGVRERKGFIMIAGDIGAGKTTMIRFLLTRFDEDVATALIFNTFLSELDLLRAINREFELEFKGASREELLAILNSYLIDLTTRGGNAVLIIDEAQNLSVPVLEQIRMLSNLETETKKLIQIILVGQPELENLLNRPELTQLKHRLTVRCYLSPLDYDDTSRYILHRLSVAGSHNLARFSPASIKLIHRFSGGVPRLINALSDRALLIAYAGNVYRVNPAAVRKADREIEGTRGKYGIRHLGYAAVALVILISVWGITQSVFYHGGLFQ